MDIKRFMHNSPLDGLLNDITNFYNSPSAKSDRDKANIVSEISSMRHVGKLLMGIGSVAIIAALGVVFIPYVGPLLGVITTVSGIALLVIGNDLNLAGKNLEVIVNQDIKNFTKSFVNGIFTVGNGSQIFKKDLIRKMVQGTLIGEFIYHHSDLSHDALRA